MTTHQAVTAVYELGLEMAKREIQDYPESDPRNAVLARDIKWMEQQLDVIHEWDTRITDDLIVAEQRAHESH